MSTIKDWEVLTCATSIDEKHECRADCEKFIFEWDEWYVVRTCWFSGALLELGSMG